MPIKKQEARLGYFLIAPAILLIAAVIFYPVGYNVWLSFHRVSMNPRRPDVFIGFDNYAALLSDPSFWHSISVTLFYTVATVAGVTLAGLGAALLLNRKFKGRGLARSVVMLPYAAPVISLVFAWQYMFNPVYGIVDHTLVDRLGLMQHRVDWLDSPDAAIWLVILFDIWKHFPLSYMMFLAKMQSIDSSLYEAAEVDGASPWRKLHHITLPELRFVIGALIILRFVWNFYKFDEIYLLTKEVPVISIYTYETAFTTYDHGLAAAVTAVLFVLIMIVVLTAARKVLKW